MAAEVCSIAAARELVASTEHTMLFEDATPAADEPGRSLLFQRPLAWLISNSLNELPQLFAQMEEARRRGLWAAGYLAYDCGYHWESAAWEPTAWELAATQGYAPQAGQLPLAVFGVYEAPVLCSAATEENATALGITNLFLSSSLEAFTERFERIQEWIAAGDTYQVNLTFQLESVYRNGAASLFQHMMRAQPVPFGAMLNLGAATILSASPELFFRRNGREIHVKPMKGTSPRGTDAEEDDRLAAALAVDEKNRAENVMIVDLLRNDLGRVAEIGSVRAIELFAVERHPSLLQMTSRVDATLREDVHAYRLFASLFPSGSIVGAPKVRTMQIIRALEGADRGPYTGAIGFFSPADEAVFSVAIRTAVLRGQRLTMGVGAGITCGSVASDEYAECLLKAEFLKEPPFCLIESMRWEGGRCDLLERHLNRLCASAEFFGFFISREEVRLAIAERGRRLPGGAAYKLRLKMTGDGRCTFAEPEMLRDEAGPYRALLWPVAVRSMDVWLRHKTTRRQTYDTALHAARERSYVDALFVNEQGAVTEGAIHSIFVRHGDRWRTPPVPAGALPGVYRSMLLEQLENVHEEEFGIDELMEADEVLLTNAVRGVRRLDQIDCARDGDDRFASFAG